jgi:hypothetical protein
MPRRSPIDGAIILARNFIEHVAAGVRAPRPPTSAPREPPAMFFLHKPLGGFALGRAEAALFRACVDKILRLWNGDHELRPLSREASEYMAMRSVQEFELWLDDRVFGEQPKS